MARVRAFLEWLGTRPPTADNVRQWVEHLQKEGYADGTVAWNFLILGGFFRRAGLEWPFRRGESPVIRENQVYAPALDTGDIKSMVEVVRGLQSPQGPVLPGADHRAFLALSTIWGMRREEMREMTPEFLDQDRRLLFVQTAKRGRQRWHMVPESILPYLAEWGFDRPVSLSRLTKIFNELKSMVGFTGPLAREVGWHSVRRSAISAADKAGVPRSVIISFFRWKRSVGDMADRYSVSRIVGRNTEVRDLDMADRQVDEVMYAHHPFLGFWQ